MDLVYWCWAIGLVSFLYWLTCLIRGIFFSHLDLFQFKYGWVAITGATDGIGKEFARQLHIKGFKVILISRSLVKLEDTKAELMREGAAEVETIEADFSKSHQNPEAFYAHMASRLETFEVSVLTTT